MPIDQIPIPTKNHCTCIGVVLRSCRSRSLFTRQNCLISDFYGVLSDLFEKLPECDLALTCAVVS